MTKLSDRLFWKKSFKNPFRNSFIGFSTFNSKFPLQLINQLFWSQSCKIWFDIFIQNFQYTKVFKWKFVVVNVLWMLKITSHQKTIPHHLEAFCPLKRAQIMIMFHPSPRDETLFICICIWLSLLSCSSMAHHQCTWKLSQSANTSMCLPIIEACGEDGAKADRIFIFVCLIIY